MKSCPLCNATYASRDTCPEDGATLITISTQTDPLIGQVLKDAYRIEEQISAGGMGVVYRATQIRLGRNVAVKVLQPRLQSTPELIKRFFREARLLSQINHPNIVKVVDVPTIAGMQCLAMEYVHGRNVQQVMRRCKEIGSQLPGPIALHIALECLVALEYAHTYVLPDGRPLDLVHRDVTPGNILVSFDGNVKRPVGCIAR